MKFILKIASVCTLILLIALAVLLVPPHIQIRSVGPALPSAAELRSLLSVENAPVGVRYIDTSSQRLASGVLGHSSILVEWANGDIVIIDAGMDKATAMEFGDLMLAMREGDKPIVKGTISQLLGDDVSRVKALAFTHLHIDHSQGVLDFCKARGTGAVALQTIFQRDLHNFNTSEGAAIVEKSCLEQQVIPGEGLIRVERFPGLGIIPLGGHTPGSTLFAVADGERLLLFSGDTTNTKAELLQDRGKGFLYSYLIVPENTARTAELRDWLRKLDGNTDMEVVVSHDLQDMAGTLEVY